jgi:hypothetical protein
MKFETTLFQDFGLGLTSFFWTDETMQPPRRRLCVNLMLLVLTIEVDFAAGPGAVKKNLHWAYGFFMIWVIGFCWGIHAKTWLDAQKEEREQDADAHGYATASFSYTSSAGVWVLSGSGVYHWQGAEPSDLQREWFEYRNLSAFTIDGKELLTVQRSRTDPNGEWRFLSRFNHHVHQDSDEILWDILTQLETAVEANGIQRQPVSSARSPSSLLSAK